MGKPVLRGARFCRQSYLNLLTTYLGYLSLGEPSIAPRVVCLGQGPTPSQRTAVAHLEASTAWWLPSSSVAAGDLGRGAGRARTTLDAIASLTSATRRCLMDVRVGAIRNQLAILRDSSRNEAQTPVPSKMAP